jgi:hypothetical protein
MWVAESRDAVESIERSAFMLRTLFRVRARRHDDLAIFAGLEELFFRKDRLLMRLVRGPVVPSEQSGPTCPQEPEP